VPHLRSSGSCDVDGERASVALVRAEAAEHMLVLWPIRTR
jgi:hypothetical protein